MHQQTLFRLNLREPDICENRHQGANTSINHYVEQYEQEMASYPAPMPMHWAEKYSWWILFILIGLGWTQILLLVMAVMAVWS